MGLEPSWFGWRPRLRHLRDGGDGVTVAVFVVDWREVVQRGVRAGGVVPVNPLGGFSFDLGATRPRFLSVDQFGLVEPIADSISALSKASPTDPMEPAIPDSCRASVKASEGTDFQHRSDAPNLLA